MSEQDADIVKAFWYGGELSPYEMLCLKSFVDHGHHVELYCYDRDLAVPRGVRLRDASEILSSDKVFFYATGPGKGSVSAFANLFRYWLLRQKGGWWVDTDVLCLSSRLPAVPRFFAWEDNDLPLIGNAVIKLPTDDPILLECLADTAAFHADMPWGTAGPYLLTATVNKLGLTGEAQPVETTYPLHHTRSFEIFDPGQADIIRAAVQNAMFHHLWHETFRRTLINKFVRPPRESYLDNMFIRHKISFPTQPAYNYAAIAAAEFIYSNSIVTNEERTRKEQAIAEVERSRDRIQMLEGEIHRLRQRVNELQTIQHDNGFVRRVSGGIGRRLKLHLSFQR